MSSWIKIRTIIGTDPAVAQIAARLKIKPAEVIGCFVLLWSWADGLTDSGEIKDANRDLIDKIADRKGFAKEAEKVGWLEATRSSIVFPKWDRHNSCSAKSRAGEATRKAEQRRAKKIKGQESGQASHDSGQMSGHLSGPEERRGEERRIEEHPPHTPEPGVGENLASPAVSAPHPTATDREVDRSLPPELELIPGFRAGWAEWVAYLAAKQRRMPTAQTFDRHLITLQAIAREHGSAAALEAMERAISLSFAAPCEPKKSGVGGAREGDAPTFAVTRVSHEAVQAGYAFSEAMAQKRLAAAQ